MGMMQGMAASNTVIQTIVTEDKRGRVMSYYTMAFMGMAPFGSLLAGTMAHAFGAPGNPAMSEEYSSGAPPSPRSCFCG
jgi:MFS family permease